MNTEELIESACSLFGEPYDDRASSTSLFSSPHGQKPEHTSLRSVAEEMEISTVKVRKLLISGGFYSTVTSRTVKRLYDEAVRENINKGECPAQAEKYAVIQVSQQTHLGRASVYSYLPFKNEAYGLEEKSAAAIRQRRYRERKRVQLSELDCGQFICGHTGVLHLWPHRNAVRQRKGSTIDLSKHNHRTFHRPPEPLYCPCGDRRKDRNSSCEKHRET